MKEITGLLLINKPIGITSFQVIRILRKQTGIQKMGHGGTLDKNACGLMIIGIGKGTKLLTGLLMMEKTYLFRVQWGKESETGDMLGSQWRYQSLDYSRITKESVKQVIKEKFTGEIWQTPPIYSALKQNGQRLSDLARSEKEVIAEPRKVFFHQCELLHFSYDSYEPSAVIRLTCSHGSYVRSFCRDIGKELGTLAVMTNLCRIKLGSYHLGHAATLGTLNDREALERRLI